MVPEEHTGKATKANPRHRRRKPDCLITRNGVVYAQRPSEAAIELWAGVISRTNERVEVDAQGVVLCCNGKRYILHLWGDDPGLYLPH